MSSTLLHPSTELLDYETYLASPVEKVRYEILDGIKVYRRYGEREMTSPSRLHQQVQGNLYLLLREYATHSGFGQCLLAPCDLLISRSPLRVRQPDLLLISRERLSENPPADEPAPLSPGPELVIEIASPSDRPGVMAAKLADYRTADVREVWVIHLQSQTIEVVSLSSEAIETVQVARHGDMVTSIAIADLRVAVEPVFAES